LATRTKKLRWFRKRWLFDGLVGGWEGACDVGVKFECSVEPLTEEFEELNNLDNWIIRRRCGVSCRRRRTLEGFGSNRRRMAKKAYAGLITC
jgi:hypothetical protein